MQVNITSLDLADGQLVDLSDEAADAIATFREMRRAAARDPESIGAVVVSMTHEVSDLLETLVLMKETGLYRLTDDGAESDADLVPPVSHRACRGAGKNCKRDSLGERLPGRFVVGRQIVCVMCRFDLRFILDEHVSFPRVGANFRRGHRGGPQWSSQDSF